MSHLVRNVVMFAGIIILIGALLVLVARVVRVLIIATVWLIVFLVAGSIVFGRAIWKVWAHLKVCALKHALRYEPRTVAKLRDRACRRDRSMA